jgi:hypothetical protein
LSTEAGRVIPQTVAVTVIGGASHTHRGAMGAFQEERQVLIASPSCKFAQCAILYRAG